MNNMVNAKDLGIVYVLTNPAMPGLVKIGKTARHSVDARLSELYTTGVPVPFECAFAGKISDESSVERAFHTAFGPYRINPSREFFQIEPEQAIALLELMVTEDVTPQLQAEANAVDTGAEDAARRLKARRPTQNFFEMGIPAGSELVFSDGTTRCEVISERKVVYNEEEYFLTTLTQALLETDKPLQPSPRWTYEGRRLSDIYNETYDTPAGG